MASGCPFFIVQRGSSLQTFPANVGFINNLKLDQKLQPKEYHIEGTYQRSKILSTDVKVLDSTGQEPYIGTYARDLEHFVKLQPEYYAASIRIDGDPSEDVLILQGHDLLNIIIMNGRVYRAGRKEYTRDPSGSLSTDIPRHLTEDLLEHDL
jgi:hypothetical protein